MDVSKGQIKKAIKKDKKREGQGIHFVLLKSIGEAVVEELSFTELEEAVDELY
jgi:3-dehydroquinate synthase